MFFIFIAICLLVCGLTIKYCDSESLPSLLLYHGNILSLPNTTALSMAMVELVQRFLFPFVLERGAPTLNQDRLKLTV